MVIILNSCEHIQIKNKAYKGIGDLFRAIESGIETNFREKKGHGGLASVFFLLEIAHTHFCTREDSGSNGATPRTSIKSLQDSLSSFDGIKSAAGNALAQINKQMHHQLSNESLKMRSSGSSSRGKFYSLITITHSELYDQIIQSPQYSHVKR